MLDEGRKKGWNRVRQVERLRYQVCLGTVVEPAQFKEGVVPHLQGSWRGGEQFGSARSENGKNEGDGGGYFDVKAVA
ncbi:UNVERIFIED_CONTAM: hypothetical protein Sangu_0675500 [Sesamum angustifolium]|uniref:Uncharacterized protein n=1 Tax=Sesamum angustifolium TaxID=2727405 RepID=A0AAW2PRN2_9LAMI